MRVYYYGIRRIFLTTAAIILSPLFYFVISGKRKKSKPLRILVIPHLTRIGDLVCATPVFRAIKEKYPDAYLSVLVAGRVEPIIRNNHRIDEIIVYRHNDLWGTIKKIRERRFDWSFSLSGTSMSTVIAFLGFIPNRAKITRRPRPFSEFITDWMANYKLQYFHHQYLPGFYLRLLKFIRIDDPEEKKEIFVTKSGEIKANDYFSKFAHEDIKVGISISAGNKIKEWGDEKFLKLAEGMQNKYGAKIIFIGAKNIEARISNLVKGKFFHATDFSLEELPSFIKKLDLFIAVDTGLIYIAHALKTPLIDIIGPVDPREQPPSDETSIQVLPTQGIKPSSFVMKKPGKPEEHKKATESISVEDVMAAVEKLLKR